MRVFRSSILVLCACAFLLTLSHCAGQAPNPVYVKDGKEYGKVSGTFRHRWWNYYERAQSYAEGGFFEESISDLNLAIKEREHDQRWARTYGMHFMDYFPHRELGIVYFNMGRYKKAEEELARSLTAVETGRAKFFLNETRRASIEASARDTLPPAIHIASTSEIRATNRFKLNLEGQVEDDSYARRIVINGEPVFVELSAKSLPFSKEIDLKKGMNEISIRGSDLLGKTTERKIKIFADFEGPALNIEDFVDGQEIGEEKIVLQGILADATGIATLEVNSKVLTYGNETRIAFSVPIDLKEGSNRIALVATDTVGNTTSGEVNLSYIPRLAESGLPWGDGASNTPVHKQPILLAFNGSSITDTGQHVLFSSAKSKQTGTAFRVDLKDLADEQTVYFDTLYVDGSAQGRYRINTVTINEEPLLIIPGQTIYFSQLIELREGENTLTLEVRDEEGNHATRTVTIIRRVPKAHQVGSRFSLAVLPMQVKEGASEAGVAVYENLVNAFVAQDRFSIIARGPDLEAAIEELRLDLSGLTDKDAAVRVGKFIAADGVLTVSIRETAESIEAYARLIDTETAGVLAATDVYGQEKSPSRIRYLMNGLALKFKHSLPLVEGIVVKASGRNVFADIGSAQGIKKNMLFIVYKAGETIIHPVTGRVLGAETEELGVATVTNVYEDMSMGKLLPGYDPLGIQARHMVITK